MTFICYILGLKSSPCSIWLITRKDDGCIKGKHCWLTAHLFLERCRASLLFSNTTDSWGYSMPSQQKVGLIFVREIQVGKVVVTRSVGRELSFPSSCSRTAFKLFYSVELPMELTQLPRLQIASPAWHKLYSLPAKFQLSLGNFVWIIQDHQMGSSGVHRSEVSASNKIRLAKEL